MTYQRSAGSIYQEFWLTMGIITIIKKIKAAVIIILLRTGSLVYTCSDHYNIIYTADTTLLVLTYMQLIKLPEIHSDHAIKFFYSVISKHEHECIRHCNNILN